jgi:hypothetical protein
MMHTPASDPVDALLDEFNAAYFVANEGGRTLVFAASHNHTLGRRVFDRMSFNDFKNLYANRQVQIGITRAGKPVMRPAAKLWLEHPRRRQYLGGVSFDPANRNGPNVFNLWQGFAIKPKAGSWNLLREHIRTVICGGHEDLFTYVLDWMADMVQHPGKQGEVAIVMRGPESSGKGVLARALIALLGQHGMAISNSQHLVGRFNGHLRDCLFLFCDEAFFAGDRAHISVLKALVTEPFIAIEAKYQNPILMPNYLHIMMASNDGWVVPAGLESRRWLVLDVAPAKVGDHNYFAAIQAEQENGGYEAMLHELLERDLTQANLRAVPMTEALQDQRRHSLDAIHAWWLNCLHRGYVFESKLGLEEHFQQWHEFMATEVLYASYHRFHQEHRAKGPPKDLATFGKWITQTTGGVPKHPRNVVTGEHMVEAETSTRLGKDGDAIHRYGRVAELIRQERARGYHLGPLADARAAFCKATGLVVDWPDDEPAGLSLVV